LFQTKAGLVEAILIPLLDLIDLVRVSSLSKQIRKLFDPKSKHHINYLRIFSERLQINFLFHPQLAQIDQKETWLEVLKLVDSLLPNIRIMQLQTFGHTYIRNLDRTFKTTEYLSYAGSN